MPSATNQTKRYQSRRHASLRAANAQAKVDALLLTDTVSIRYLTGVTEGAIFALILGKDAIVVTRRMFADKIPTEAIAATVIIEDDLSLPNILKKLIRTHKISTLGYEEDRTLMSLYKEITSQISPRKLRPLNKVVEHVRMIKDDIEIATIKKCIRIQEKAMREMIAAGLNFFLGKTEKQLAAELEYRMRNLGADRQGFPFNGIIVGSGPNSASAHHFPTTRKIKKGDPILFDWGAEVDGYRSDMTRVLFMGSVHPKIGTIYPIVEQAMKTAIAYVKPGRMTNNVDAAARDVITQAGFGELFRHGLGHGIGLEIHEQPFMKRPPHQKLKKNMIITIEPGIYFDGIGGVRLENDILVTATGRKDLCTLPTKIEKMIIQ